MTMLEHVKKWLRGVDINQLIESLLRYLMKPHFQSIQTK